MMNEPTCRRCWSRLADYDIVVPAFQMRRPYENAPLQTVVAGYVHLSCIANPHEDED